MNSIALCRVLSLSRAFCLTVVAGIATVRDDLYQPPYSLEKLIFEPLRIHVMYIYNIHCYIVIVFCLHRDLLKDVFSCLGKNLPTSMNPMDRFFGEILDFNQLSNAGQLVDAMCSDRMANGKYFGVLLLLTTNHIQSTQKMTRNHWKKLLFLIHVHWISLLYTGT